MDVYGQASRQNINYQKSKIFFNSNTPSNVKNIITSKLEVSEGIGNGKYLCLPSMVRRNKKKTVFNFLKDRLWKRINHWSNKHNSKASKEVLIKSYAQAIPTYCMSVFLLPTSLDYELQKMMKSFWWRKKTTRDIN